MTSDQGESETPSGDIGRWCVDVHDLRKTFRARHDRITALDGVSLSVRQAEMLVLLGPSGCGKTTLLRSIGGLEQPDSGKIAIEGRTVYSSTPPHVDIPPERRNVGFVFQSYALWPHMTVEANVAYPLRASGISRNEASRQAGAALELVGIGDLGGRHPGQLSGGQQQRVALARAIVAKRPVIFFDEPLSNVDAKVRERLRLELLRVRDAVGFAGVYVTHDQSEAMVIGDRIAVMRGGSIVQIGAPQEIYERPASRWVADFIGMANFVDGVVVESRNGAPLVKTDIGTVAVDSTQTVTAVTGRRVVVFFRPEWCRVIQSEGDGPNRWPCIVRHSLYVGGRFEILVDVGTHSFVAHAQEPFASGASVWLEVPSDRTQVLEPE